MDEYLEWSDGDRRLACDQAAATTGLVAASIEKDYWVSLTLRELFALPTWGEELTFKGGTSLSKGWKLIDRFSEDIDVVVDRRFLGFAGELSNNRRKRLVETCSQRVHDELRPRLRERFEGLLPNGGWKIEMADASDDKDQQTLLFHYLSIYAGDRRYIRPMVRIDLGARSDTDPVERPAMRPILAEALENPFSQPVFSVRTVSPKRTFWEKATLMHEELQRPDGLPRERLARHLYDLWCMVERGVAADAAADPALFDSVVSHRSLFFRRGWVDYSTMRLGTLRLVPEGDQIRPWRLDYDAMRGGMFYGSPPPFEDMCDTLRRFQEEVNASAGA